MCRPSIWTYIKFAPFCQLEFINHSIFVDSRTECQGIFDFSISMACQQYDTSGILLPIRPWDSSGDLGIPRRLPHSQILENRSHKLNNSGEDSIPHP